MPDASLTYNVAKSALVDSAGYALNTSDLPKLIFSERPRWTLTVKNGSNAVNMSDCATFAFAIAEDWDTGTVAGALTASKSGAVTIIAADGFASAPPSAGVLHLTNSNGDTEAVGYSSWTVNTNVYSFVVSQTLSYAYANDDSCVFEESPPMVRIENSDITSTSKATGIVSFDVPTDNNVFLGAVEGKSAWTSCVGQLCGYDSNGYLVIVVQFGLLARGLIDTNMGDLPGPASNYYTKAEVVAMDSLKLNSDLSGLTVKGTVDDADSTFINDSAAAGAPKKTLFSTIKTYMGLTFEPIISKLTAFNKNYSTTATDIKINGTQSLGSNDTLPRSDHVHPTDTSREAAGTAASAVSTHAGKTDGSAHTTSGINGLDTALSNKQPLDAGLTSISALTTSSDKMIYTTAPDTYATTSLTEAGRALLDDASAAVQRATLGTPALNGFENRTDSSLSMSGSNFQITTASSWNIWTNGTKHSFTTAQSVAISNDLALHYVYFNTSGVLSVSTSAWDIESDNVPVATVYKDGTTYAIQDERHNYKRDRQWHKWAHDTIGTRYESGLTGTFGNNSLSIAQGEIHDEDINYDTLATKTACRLWYRHTGAATLRFVENVSTPYKSNSGTIQYDNAGTLTNVDTSKYVCNYVYVAADSAYPIQVVVGQAQHSTLATAQSEALPTIPLATVEWKLIYKVIYRNVGGTATYIEAADYRTVSTGPAVAAIANSHAALIGRDAVDQHPYTAITGLGTAATGTTGTASGNIPTRPADNYLSADHISEITSGHGVDIDGVVCKDSGIQVSAEASASLGSITISANDPTIRFVDTDGDVDCKTYEIRALGGASKYLQFRKINDAKTVFTELMKIESNGSLVVGTDPGGSEKLRVGGDISVGDNTVKTNHIAEVTSAHGVDVDSVLLKDGKIKLATVAAVYDTVLPAVLKNIYKQHKSLTTANKNRLTVVTAADNVSTPTGTYPGGSAFAGGVLLPDGRVFCMPLNSTSARIYDPATDTLSTPTGTYPGGGAFVGGVLLPDGRVFCVPCNSTSARIYDPVTDTLSTPTGTYPGGYAFQGGVLLPDGRVFCVPSSSTTARIYDPVADTLSTPTGTYPGNFAFVGGVLLPDGRVFCVPSSSTTARIYDTATDTLSTPTGTYPGSVAFIGGVLLPDGRVFCVPYNSTTARIYDTATDTLSTPTGTYPGDSAFQGGVLLPDGRVFCVPFNSTSARIYDPVADNVSTPTGTYPGNYAFTGGVLLPDGRVFCVPYNSTAARIADGAYSHSSLNFPMPLLLGGTLNKL